MDSTDAISVETAPWTPSSGSGSWAGSWSGSQSADSGPARNTTQNTEYRIQIENTESSLSIIT